MMQGVLQGQTALASSAPGATWRDQLLRRWAMPESASRQWPKRLLVPAMGVPAAGRLRWAPGVCGAGVVATAAR